MFLHLESNTTYIAIVDNIIIYLYQTYINIENIINSKVIYYLFTSYNSKLAILI